MTEPQDHWQDETYADDGGSGLLGQTVRNIGLLIVACLLVAGGLQFGTPSGDSDSLPEPPEPAAVSPAPGREVAHATALGEELIIPAGQGGHFLVDARVDGVEIRFLVDTGASQVVLTAADAERLGYRLENLDFSDRFQTANGVIEGAPIVLPDLSIGDLEVEDVRSSVIRAPMTMSLLGMSFLRRLESYEVRGNGLVLRW